MSAARLDATHDPLLPSWGDSADHRAAGALVVTLESWLATPAMAQPAPLATSSLLDADWTLTQGGRQPLTLPCGEQRVFLHDGDSVILRGAARIGFGTLASAVRG